MGKERGEEHRKILEVGDFGLCTVEETRPRQVM